MCKTHSDQITRVRLVRELHAMETDKSESCSSQSIRSEEYFKSDSGDEQLSDVSSDDEQERETLDSFLFASARGLSITEYLDPVERDSLLWFDKDINGCPTGEGEYFQPKNT